MNKYISLDNFSNFAYSYNKWAIPQLQSAQYLTKRIFAQTGSAKIIDAGCGTGILTKSLLMKNYNLQITGLELSKTALLIYKKINSRCIQSNIENLHFIKSNAFDEITSNFALHWTNLEQSLYNLIRIAKKAIHFAIPIKGSLNQFLPKKKLFTFPQLKQIKTIIKNLGFTLTQYEIIKIPIPYIGLKLLHYFRYTGTVVQKPSMSSAMDIKEWLKKDENTQYNYNVLFVTLKK